MRLTIIFVLALCLARISFGQNKEHDINALSLDSLLNINISSASRHWQKTFEAPSTVSIINADEIEKFGYRTLDEVLNSLAGFYTSYDRNYAYLGVRGFSRPTDYNNRILILVNEHPVNENIFGSSSMGYDLGLPLSSVERIEIVRGPGSALYGTGAMFAVINIVTKTGKSYDKTSIYGGAGSLGRYSGILNFGTVTKNELEFFAGGEYYNQKGGDLYFKEFDTDTTNHGVASGMDKEEYYGFITTLTYKNFRLQGKFSNRIKTVPTAPYGVLFNDNMIKTEDGGGFLEGKYILPFSTSNNLTMLASLDYYSFRAYWPYDDLLQDEKSDGVWLTLNIQNTWSTGSSNVLISGLEFKNDLQANYKLWDESLTIFDMNKLSSVFSIYAQDEYQFYKNLSLIGSVRFDNHSSMSSYFSPRAAVIYNFLPSSILKLIVGSSLRVPSPYELYYEDPTSNFIPNPSLSPERIIEEELVFEQRFSRNIYSVFSVYSYRVENLIDQRFDEVDSTLQYQNFSKVNAAGFDADFNYAPSKGIKAYLRYSFQHATDPSSDENLTNYPAHLVKAGLVWPVNQFFNCAAEVIYETKRKCIDGSETKDYVLTGLNISSNNLFEGLRLSLRIKNLFNTAYYYPGGFEHIQSSILQDGRTYFFTAGIEF